VSTPLVPPVPGAPAPLDLPALAGVLPPSSALLAPHPPQVRAKIAKIRPDRLSGKNAMASSCAEKWLRGRAKLHLRLRTA
jgi:hypothetical protein